MICCLVDMILSFLAHMVRSKLEPSFTVIYGNIPVSRSIRNVFTRHHYVIQHMIVLSLTSDCYVL